MSMSPQDSPAVTSAKQQPEWPDAGELERVVKELKVLPPLVFPSECDLLTQRLADVSRGEAFFLTGGDCAETFAANTANSVRARLKTVLQMAVVLTYGATLPVVKVGRIAGQYFKPRSANEETINGVTLPSYRGDAINDVAFTPEARRPDPQRLIRAYKASNATLNLIRSFSQDGSADLRMVHAWNRDFVAQSDSGRKYDQLAKDIDRALAFMHACGADPVEFRSVEFFTAHEALLLDYEKAMSRTDYVTGRTYDTSAHFLWMGERTREPNGAHTQFMASISNPIGCKVGPKANPEDVINLIKKLDPDKTPGRLTLISRMGAGNVLGKLPPIIKAVEETGHPVIWVCDPMHGNTKEAASGHKTREFADVLSEVKDFFVVHKQLGTHPGGL
ncbi:MAG: 3-deoxy-7-phosphoheptulonate synthase class II, partial [Candidatus Nanopelagicales bacterium]